jgi:hypothetical protein
MLCALLAVAAFAPLPAAAQQGQSYAVARADIMDAMTVVNNADMYFGVITPGTANGTVVMTPNDQSNAAACAVNNGITRSGPCRAARFEGQIPFIHNLVITKPAGDQVMLTGPSGATMRLRRFTVAAGSGWMFGTDLATTPTVSYFVLGGTFVIYVGGTLDVARNQRAGVYNGSFTLTFNYN